MSGRNLLLDSNTVIYIAQKQLDPTRFAKPEDRLFISDVTYMETLGYAFPDPAERLETETLLAILYRLPIQEDIVQKVIEIRQSYRLKLPDAIIAATALIHDCVLITRNTADFSNIVGLSIVNPMP